MKYIIKTKNKFYEGFFKVHFLLCHCCIRSSYMKYKIFFYFAHFFFHALLLPGQ